MSNSQHSSRIDTALVCALLNLTSLQAGLAVPRPSQTSEVIDRWSFHDRRDRTMPRIAEQSVDKILVALGPTGRYQLLQMIVSLLGSIPGGLQLLGNVFICDPAPHHCAPAPTANQTAYIQSLSGADNSSNVVYGQCNITVWSGNASVGDYSCLFGVDYELDRDMSAISQFDLVCDRKPLASLAQSLVIVGQGVGAMLTTPISDRLGRKVVLVFANVGLLTEIRLVSISAQFDLVCDRKPLASLAQSLVIVGQGVGAMLTTPISDRLGRKVVLVFANVGLLTSGLCIAFAPNYVVFTIFKFIVGAFQQAAITTGVTFTLELYPIRDRRLSAVAAGSMWASGVMILPLISFLLRDYNWRITQATYSATSLLVLLQIWYLDESLRWLMANGKTQNIDNIIRRAARVNGKNLDDILQVYHQCNALASEEPLTTETSNGDEADSKPKAVQKMSFLDLFRFKRLFINALIMWFAWFVTALGFFVLYLTATSLAGDPYLNFFLIACMELPSGVIFYLCLNRWGRKWTTAFLFFLLSLGLVLAGVFRYMGASHLYENLTLASSLIAMIGATGSFDAVFHYTPEMFPTNIRNQALGVSSFIGRVGGMLAPFIGILADLAIWAPGVLIGSMACLVCILLSALPETKGRELPQTLDDLHGWYSKAYSHAVTVPVEERANGREKMKVKKTDE
ncbi:solute carrier family 22 member 8, partial [Aplysia californica]|uniref:Solute carrier family 22 member 8 n=1 Tax=Aplysia californica TaxID=6500 RepID=A0ABM1AEW2_APLCA